MDFPRAHADTAYDPSVSFPGRGARGTYVPPQGGSFAWRTDEWYLAPETLMPTKGRAGASEHVHDPSRAARVVGSALTAPLVAAEVRAPPGPLEPSPGARVAPGSRADSVALDQAVPGRVSGSTKPEPRPGAAPLGRRRKGAAPRACSAVGCVAHVLDRAQGLVVMCPAHRRVTSGVAVDTGDELMRWCYHCKKAHELGAFADSVIGLSRKLATCERGRAARRAAFAKKAADGARAAIEGTPDGFGALGGFGGGFGDAHSGDGPRTAGTAGTDPSSQTELLTADETTGRATVKREEPAGFADGAKIVPALRAGSGHGYRIKSEAETLAAVASARARGRPKRQQDLLDANPSCSGSPAYEKSVSGSRGSFRAEPAFQDIGNAPVPNQTPSGMASGTAAPGHWPLRAFEEVAFEVSTRAAPAELIGDKHSVFEQMAGFVSRAVLSDTADPYGEADPNANANPWTSDGSGSAVVADQFLRSNEPMDADAGGETTHDRRARAADAVRRESANFFMGLGEVQSLLDANEAEASFESSEPQNGGELLPSHAKAAASRGWFDALAATILPGSTRVICTTRAGFGPGAGAVPDSSRGGFSHPDAATLARAMPPGGALGRRTATVTAHPNVRVGAGWIRDEGFGSADSRQTRRADSVVVAVDAPESGLARQRVTPFPSYVTVSPVAAMGDHIIIGGLRGGERVHVFGQGARPFSAVVPRGVDAARIATPRLAVGAAGAPGIVPGFVYVQVLAPGQPATGSAFVKVLLVDGPAVLAELDALGRGAGALRALLVPAGAPALPAARGFVGPAAFERFLHDLGALLESHWRSLLYTPAGRAATRVITEGFYGVVAGAAFPALRAALADVVEDVDAQKLFEKDAFFADGVVSENVGFFSGGNGFFATPTPSSRRAEHAERRRKRNVANRTLTSSNGRRQERRGGAGIDVRSWALLEDASRANIAATRVFARGVVAAVATRLAPSRATRLALRAVLDNRSDIARRVFSYDEVVAMSPQTRVSLYCHSMMVVSLILLVALFRAEDWGTTPVSLLGCFVPAFPVLLLYGVGTRDARVLRWLQNRSWMMGSGGALLDIDASGPALREGGPSASAASASRARRTVRHSHAHDVFVFTLLMACNGAVRSLTLDSGRDSHEYEWIHGAMMLFGNSIMFAVFSAEYVRPGRKRLDIPAVVIAGAALYGCPPNTWAKLARAPSPASAAAEHFLLSTHSDAKMLALMFFAVPCLAGALARRACRAHNRLALFAKVDAAAMVDPAEANAKRTS